MDRGVSSLIAAAHAACRGSPDREECKAAQFCAKYVVLELGEWLEAAFESQLPVCMCTMSSGAIMFRLQNLQPSHPFQRMLCVGAPCSYQ
jgi:hypothetical protein